jgi:hypothetical protein
MASLALSFGVGFTEDLAQSLGHCKLDKNSRREVKASTATKGELTEKIAHSGLNIHAGSEQIVSSASSTKMCSPWRSFIRL